MRLAARDVRLTLLACSAGGQTWGLGFADLGDPTLVAGALAELRSSAAANVAADAAADPLPLAVPGATPHSGAGRLQLTGRLPDGRAVREEAAVFAKGTRVFQATVLGDKVPAEAAETFFASLRVES